MEKINNIKGTKDIIGDETFVWQYIEKSIHSFLQRFGYTEIRTPMFENSQLFNRSIGEETDIVSKEMYSWIDQGNNHLTLKPEATAAVARAFIQHNLGRKSNLNRLYYIDSFFRRERPQKGRYRQFKQFGIEALGSKYPEQDAEIICTAFNFYTALGIKNITLKINSIGSKEIRNNYKKILSKYLKPFLNQLSDTSQKRLKSNPLRILDTKNKIEIDIIKDAPKILDYISEDDKKHFDKVLFLLDQLNIPYEIDHSLVRGLDYYSRTVFEIQSSQLGAQSALGGGGRYDYLIEDLGGNATPSIGFAAGIERLILALNNSVQIPQPDIYIIALDDNALEYTFPIAQSLRLKNNLTVIHDTLRRSFKAQLKEANKINAQNVIIVGEDEIKNKNVIIKNMDSGKQQNITFDKISDFFK